MIITRRPFLKGTWALMTGLFLLSLIPTKILANPSTIKIGLVDSLTGPLASFGVDTLKGAGMAVEEINHGSGVLGAKLQLISYDLPRTVTNIDALMSRLSREGVLAIIGPSTSPFGNEIMSRIAEQQCISLFISNPFTDKIFQEKKKFTFRIQPGLSDYSVQAVKYTVEIAKEANVSVKTISLFWVETPVWQKSADVIKNVAKENGLEVTEMPYSPQARDFAPDVTKAKQIGPDLIFNLGDPSQSKLLIGTIREFSAFPKAIIGLANFAFSNPMFVAEHEDLFLDVMDINCWWNPKLSTSADIKEKFKKKYGSAISNNAFYAYTVIYLLRDALNRVGKPDHEEAGAELRRGKFSDHSLAQIGPIKFDEHGRNKNAAAVMLQVMNPVPKVIYPDPFSEAPPKFHSN